MVKSDSPVPPVLFGLAVAASPRLDTLLLIDSESSEERVIPLLGYDSEASVRVTAYRLCSVMICSTASLICVQIGFNFVVLELVAFLSVFRSHGASVQICLTIEQNFS